MADLTRITVLISGNGTNLQALIDKIGLHQVPATIVRVVSNRKDAFGLQRAQRAQIPTLYHNLLKYKKKHPVTDEGARAAREEYDADLARLVLQDGPELIVCLGFLHVLSESFLDPIKSAHVKIINLHPALPGAFSGANAIERAHTAWKQGKVEKTGVMIHHVISEVDMGTPVLVREIPFLRGTDDDVQALEQRIHQIEWDAVVEATNIVIKELSDEKTRKSVAGAQTAAVCNR